MTNSNAREILARFRRIYPDPRSELNFRSSFELLVSVMLSAQCTDKKVNEIAPSLFKRFKNFEQLSKAKISEVERIIRPINYYRTKSKHIVEMAKEVHENLKDTMPRTHDDLTKLPGVGRKTANVILGELRIEPSLPVDTHVFRVAKRLGFATGKTPEKVEEDLKKAFPSKDWYNLHHWLIYHGRRVCKAQRPLCSECKVRNFCPSAEDF